MVDAAGLTALALVAFAGGAFGAALGATRAFSVAGLLIVAGEVLTVARGSASGAGDPAALGATGITGTLGLGPAFGPHVAFAGGLAAAAYGARRGYLATGFDYHEAKNVTHALGPRADVLAVGGAFGIIGAGIARTSAGAGLPWDPVMAAVVASGLLHRIAFGYPIVGSVHNGLLNMTPFERGIRRPSRESEIESDGGTGAGAGAAGEGMPPEEAATAGTRYAVEPWLPHQYRWGDVALLGAVVGAFSAFVTYRTGSPLLAFGIAAASLAFLRVADDRVPVTYHMALPAGIAVVGLAGRADPALLDATAYVPPGELAAAVSLPVALVAGGAFGLLAGVGAELVQRALYAHADTHLDPGAAGVVLATLVVAALDAAGVLAQNLVPAF